MIECQVDTRPLERRLQSLIRYIGPYTEIATREALEHIHQKAMQNLNTNLKWGHSVVNPDDSIENSMSINVEINGTDVVGSLVYKSPHARLQEYGGTYVAYAKEDGKMSIGKEQGDIVAYKDTLVGVIQGKFFLTSAFATEGDSVRAIYEKYVNKTIRDSE